MSIAGLMTQAYRTALQSHDPSTQNGTLLVWNGEIMALGWNHIPKVYGEELTRFLNDRDLKYPRVIHGEVDAIAYAASQGIRTAGLTMVAPWAACLNCAAVIIQARIGKLIVHGPRMRKGHPLGWVPQVDEAIDRLAKSGIKIEVFDEPLPDAPSILVAGEPWQP